MEPAEASEEKIHDTWVLLAHSYRIISNLWDKELSQYGFTHEQAFILFIINYLGDYATPSNIARFQVQAHNTVSEVLSRMEKSGFIEKSSERTGRSRLRVRLTDKGHLALETSSRKLTLVKIMRSLPEENLDQLQHCLKMLLNRAVEENDFPQKSYNIRTPPSAWLKEGIN